MSFPPLDPPAAVVDFLVERHLATLTTLRADGSPHVVAVGFTYDPATGLARVITNDGSAKVRNAERPGTGGASPRAAVGQVDGRRWLSLEGPVRVSRDPAEIADAVERYSARYRVPRENPNRVALLIEVERLLGHA
ncbi:PPOX class probable F420-dependent enzyme [Nakamurella flavida]|uniref:pyridoxamine 5'-phosphate oxidase family protein n=1 Tax=Nakamurella flavida TaxID=363630 RepID=UPI002784E3CE|nr:TIGR03618 family F420-dependent PPOX class oxidoreductase [Nakamurella flavida]MDP9779993.1 PPOX class probable F420-dependent enzyme [Nakamurella flavida]